MANGDVTRFASRTIGIGARDRQAVQKNGSRFIKRDIVFLLICRCF